MAQNITLLGASYPDVPAVELPKTGGGTASFTDVTDTTAVAEDVAQGKYFYTASGVKTEGTGSGGGGGISADDIATYNYSELIGASASFIAPYAFCSNTALVSASFPECKSIYIAAFSRATNLKTAYFPSCETIAQSAFAKCEKLESVDFAACSSIGVSAFASCTNLTALSFSNVRNIFSYAFSTCTRLVELDLRGVSAVPSLRIGAFSYTPIGGYSGAAKQFGSIFVPASLYEAFQIASNWSSVASRMVSV